MPKALSKQSQMLSANVIKYFEKELENGGPLLPLTAVRERATDSLQLSKSVIHKISGKIARGELLTSPKKSKKRAKPVTEVDSFTETAIRNVIYEMYAKKSHVSCKALLEILKFRDIFHGSLSSLTKVLRNIGFSWKQDDNRRAIYELPHIISKRIHFLTNFMRNVNQSSPHKFVFLDETWIFQKGSAHRSWQEADVKSVKRKTTSDGKRYIILHAGTEDGWVPNSSLIFASKTKSDDYHGEMNNINFTKWFKEQLVPNLAEPSIIIMDNATYHSTMVEKNPREHWTKAEIQAWLGERNIDYSQCTFKRELLDLAAENKVAEKYVIDEYALENGHMVLRLPPYHCIFNAIENIWGISKTYYNKHIGRDGYGDKQTLDMWEEALESVSPAAWRKTVKHTMKEIKQWYDREVFLDQGDQEPLIININTEDDSSEEESELE